MPVLSVRLPVVATVKAAYTDVFGDFRVTLRALSLLFALLVVFVEVPLVLLSGYVEKNLMAELERTKALINSGIDAHTAAAINAHTSGLDPKFIVMTAALAVYALQMVFLFRFMQGWYRQWLLGENKGSIIGLRLGRGERQLMVAGVKAGLTFIPFLFASSMILAAAFPGGDINLAPQFHFWPYLGVVLVAAIYVQARISLAYPVTAMSEDATACVRQSWKLTKQQGTRIALGNLAVMIPMIGIAWGLFQGLAWGLSVAVPESVSIKDGSLLDLSLQLLFKVMAEFCTLIMMAGLSAYHSRCYAYLVRSSSNSSVH